MDIKTGYLSLEIVFLWCSLSMGQACPSPCRCVAQSVICNGSHLNTMPADVHVNTIDLDLSKNDLTVIQNQSQLQNLPNLKTLILKQNMITEIQTGAFLGLDELKYLDLSFNQLKLLDHTSLAGLGKLRTLILQDNLHLCMDFGSLSMMPHLEILNLGKTGVKFIPGLFENSTKLPTRPMGLLELRLSKTGLTDVPYETLKLLPNITILDLSQNGIQHLSHHVFRNNGNLKQLDLSSNPIIVVESDTFQGLTSLSQLMLDSTHTLSQLPEGVFDPLPSNVKVCMFGNRWACDCYLKWLKVWTEKDSRVHCAGKPNCYSPAALQSHPINSVPATSFTCDSSDRHIPPIQSDTKVMYAQGFCSKVDVVTNENRVELINSTATPPNKKIPQKMSTITGLIITTITIIAVTLLIVGAFVVRHLRIKKKLYDQTKYFNISYENGSQLQLAESPTPDKGFH